ncbi:uncharacterized protein LOC120353057 [Nilaparvata lugens]|uniref:uncharacterized protein LOC120353057 n=1 Tax=Nilaparvata lugens TaxID=108931 RepID=UPI00193EA6EF|nr:uncharacterized protein LOC120353057 [Nilaparvata lugens]
MYAISAQIFSWANLSGLIFNNNFLFQVCNKMPMEVCLGLSWNSTSPRCGQNIIIFTRLSAVDGAVLLTVSVHVAGVKCKFREVTRGKSAETFAAQSGFRGDTGSLL